MALYWGLFILFLLYFVVYETWWGLTGYKKIMKSVSEGTLPKTHLYKKTLLSLWIPTGLVMILIFTDILQLKDIGLNWIRPYSQSLLFYIALVLASLYFIYLVYSLTVLKINAMKKISLNQKLPEEVKVMLPITSNEKKVWVVTAISAGITEEILFRGFLFFLMGQLFPALNIFWILGAATLIFGIGHLYQGLTEAVKPMLIGFMFGLFYIAFGSILPCILLHAMQDLCATYIINE